MTYRGQPSMTSYQIAMTFGEIEPIYQMSMMTMKTTWDSNNGKKIF